MDLKLKDEVTKTLIENPGLSISDIAKKTKNYYSYTHKLLSEMESKGLVNIKKNKDQTSCYLSSDYKKLWVSDVNRFIKSLLKDAEVKASILLTIILVAVNSIPSESVNSATPLLYEGARAAELPSSTSALARTNVILYLLSSFIALIIIVLFIIWLVKNREKIDLSN